MLWRLALALVASLEQIVLKKKDGKARKTVESGPFALAMSTPVEGGQAEGHLKMEVAEEFAENKVEQFQTTPMTLRQRMQSPKSNTTATPAVSFQEYLERFLDDLHQGLPPSYREEGKKVWAEVSSKYEVPKHKKNQFNSAKHRLIERLQNDKKQIPSWVDEDPDRLRKFNEVREMFKEARKDGQLVEEMDEGDESEDLEIEDEEEPEIRMPKENRGGKQMIEIKKEGDGDRRRTLRLRNENFRSRAEAWNNREKSVNNSKKRRITVCGTEIIGPRETLLFRNHLFQPKLITEEKVAPYFWSSAAAIPLPTFETPSLPLSPKMSQRVERMEKENNTLREKLIQSREKEKQLEKSLRETTEESQKRIKELETKLGRLEDESEQQGACSWKFIFEYRTKWDKLSKALREKDLEKIEKNFPEIFTK